MRTLQRSVDFLYVTVFSVVVVDIVFSVVYFVTFCSAESVTDQCTVDVIIY